MVDWKTVDFSQLDPGAQADLFRQSRESLAEDPYRPLYHFSPPGANLHDPAGLCWWSGKYHLFYLFSTPKYRWARGHAISDDLVHWYDLPLVNRTIQGRTGQVWAESDRVILGYASHDHRAVSVATATDPLLQEWVEHPRNPVYRNPRGALQGLMGTADNYLWREDDTYYLTLRHFRREPADILTGSSAVEICRSKDLAVWETMGHLFEDIRHTEPGEDCSCNNFLPLGNGKHLLLFFSHKRSAQYYIGSFDRDACRFGIEQHGRMNYGPVKRGSLHAPSAFIDSRGRCIGMWNILENRSHRGWDEIMSLPRQLSINEDGSPESRNLNPLRIEPIEELESLRAESVSIDATSVPANGEYLLPGVEGNALEIAATLDPLQAREVGINVLRSSDGKERTSVTLYQHGWPRSAEMREIAIDVSSASLDTEVRSRTPEIGPLYLPEKEPLQLRIFVDRSIIEVFANGRQCLTLRTYPSRDDSRGVSVFARGSEARLQSLTAYRIKSIWSEFQAPLRLPTG